MELTLHLGVHRTGVAALQHLLERHEDLLFWAGTRFWGPRQMRSGRRKDYVPGIARAKGNESVKSDFQPVVAGFAEDFKCEASDGFEHLIVSDENLLGAMFENYSEATLYSEAQAWLEAAATLFPVPPARVFLCLRDYADYAVSIYSHLAMRLPMPDFDAGRLEQLGAERGWDAVLRDVAAVFPTARISVWRYPGPTRAMKGIVSAMVNDNAAERVEETEVAATAPPSAAALKEISRLWHASNAGSSKDRRHEAERLKARLPGPPLRPFSEAQLTAMRARFDADWNALAKGRVPGVETFDPWRSVEMVQ